MHKPKLIRTELTQIFSYWQNAGTTFPGFTQHCRSPSACIQYCVTHSHSRQVPLGREQTQVSKLILVCHIPMQPFLHWAHVSSWKPLKAKLLSHFGVSSCLPTWKALQGLKKKFLHKAMEDPNPAHKEAAAAHGTLTSTKNVGYRFGLSESCCLMFRKPLGSELPPAGTSYLLASQTRRTVSPVVFWESPDLYKYTARRTRK